MDFRCEEEVLYSVNSLKRTMVGTCVLDETDIYLGGVIMLFVDDLNRTATYDELLQKEE